MRIMMNTVAINRYRNPAIILNHVSYSNFISWIFNQSLAYFFVYENSLRTYFI